MSTTALRAFIRELAAPSIPPKSAPIRRGPVHWFTYTIEDLTGWSLEVAYRWDQEPGDRVEVEIVQVLLYTPAGNTKLDTSALGENRSRIEDAIREEVELKLDAAKYDDHQPGRERI